MSLPKLDNLIEVLRLLDWLATLILSGSLSAFDPLTLPLKKLISFQLTKSCYHGKEKLTLRRVSMDRLEYLSKFGFRVFPCWLNSKHPMTKTWQDIATHNPKIIGNYGVLASGAPYGCGTIAVVDLDKHHDEMENGVEYWEKNNLPSDTFTVLTPSGGMHLYFVCTPQQIASIKSIGGQKLRPQIDFFWEQKHFVMGVGSSIDGKCCILWLLRPDKYYHSGFCHKH